MKILLKKEDYGFINSTQTHKTVPFYCKFGFQRGGGSVFTCFSVKKNQSVKRQKRRRRGQ